METHNVARPATTEPRTEEQRQAELREIAEYQSLVELIEQKISEHQYTLEVLQLTSRLLTKNPEYYTIWNVRRRLLTYGLFSKSSGSSLRSSLSPNTSPIATTTTSIESSSSSTSTSFEASSMTQGDPSHQNHGRNGTTLELIESDLVFLIPLLKQWPKCYWIWNHRSWLLHEAIRRLDTSVARRLWQVDLDLVRMMLVKDSRNFHAWGYRRIVVAMLESSTLNGTSMLESEFEYTTKMINANLSNFSAWHNRSKLIPRLLNERNADAAARRKFLDDEFEMLKNALWVDSSDQSLWYYYQFLMTSIIDLAAKEQIVMQLTQTDQLNYLAYQLTELRELLDGADNPKWIYTALTEYTTAMWGIKGQPPPEVKQEVKSWLEELRRIDPLRAGRWNDMEASLCSE